MLDRLRAIPRLAVLAGLATSLALVLSVSVVVSTSDLSRRNCQQIQQVYTRIQTIVRQGQKTLGQPGSAGYAYYLAHPSELAQARRANADAVLAFAPRRCP